MCIYGHAYGHTKYINSIFSHLTTSWFSLHRIPELQNGKCSGKKTSGKPNSCAVCSYSMQHLSFSSDKLYWMINSLFPPFFSGAHHYSDSKDQMNARRPHVIPTFPLRREDVQRLLSSACALPYTCWTTSKENWKSIGYYKAGNLPGITDKQWHRAHGWGMVTDGYNWSHKEGDGEGEE